MPEIDSSAIKHILIPKPLNLILIFKFFNFLIRQEAIVNCYLLIVNSQHLGLHDAFRDGGEYAVGPRDACLE